VRKFKAHSSEIGQRADVFITSKYPEFTRSSLENLFERELVSLISKPVKASYRLRAGDVLVVDDSILKLKVPNIDLPIIYEDNDVIVINKPEGVLTHSKGAVNDEATVATFIRPKVDESLSGNRAGIVHRLDRATSGVIICAKNGGALKHLQKQFSQRRTNKIYTAIADGVPAPAEAIIDAPIERNPKRPQTFRVSQNGKPATTHYKVQTVYNGGINSLLELKPKTGRTHQLRVHMAYVKAPITGDRIYGQPAEHMYLHASSLEITIPSGERKIFTAALPDYFKDYTDGTTSQ